MREKNASAAFGRFAVARSAAPAAAPISTTTIPIPSKTFALVAIRSSSGLPAPFRPGGHDWGQRGKQRSQLGEPRNERSGRLPDAAGGRHRVGRDARLPVAFDAARSPPYAAKTPYPSGVSPSTIYVDAPYP